MTSWGSTRERFAIGWLMGLAVALLDVIRVGLPPPGHSGVALGLAELGIYPVAAGTLGLLLSLPPRVRHPERLSSMLSLLVVWPWLLLSIFPLISVSSVLSPAQWPKIGAVLAVAVLVARELGRAHRILARLAPPPILSVLCGVVMVVAAGVVVIAQKPKVAPPDRHASASGPNVILITLDTVRRDALGCYGGDPTTTPGLDSMAATGMRFAHVTSCAPWTLASVSSIMTGLYPSGTGVFTGKNRLAERFETMAEVFAANGYYTHAIVSNTWLREQFGVAQGFAEYDHRAREEIAPELYKFTLYRAARRLAPPKRYVPPESATGIVQQALALLRSDPPQPMFLWLHFNDVHDPYAPPWPYLPRDKSYRGQFRISSGRVIRLREGYRTSIDDRARLEALYRGELRYVDTSLRALFGEIRAQGLENRTAIAVLSDHGEEFWEHGSVGHGHTLFEELLRVPFLLSFPAMVPADSVNETPCTLADVAPTLLSIADLSPRMTHGVPLLHQYPGEDRPRVAEGLDFFWELKAVSIGNRKLIVDPASGHVRLFDILSDPEEVSDLGRAYPEIVSALKDTLSTHLARARADADRLRLEQGESDVILTPELRKQLQAQGYLE